MFLWLCLEVDTNSLYYSPLLKVLSKTPGHQITMITLRRGDSFLVTGGNLSHLPHQQVQFLSLHFLDPMNIIFPHLSFVSWRVFTHWNFFLSRFWEWEYASVRTFQAKKHWRQSREWSESVQGDQGGQHEDLGWLQITAILLFIRYGFVPWHFHEKFMIVFPICLLSGINSLKLFFNQVLVQDEETTVMMTMSLKMNSTIVGVFSPGLHRRCTEWKIGGNLYHPHQQVQCVQ